MSNLFQKAKSWLPAQVKAAAGVTVAVTRGGTSATLTAVIGRTVYAVNRPDGARIEFGERDFLVTAADLVAANPDWTEPAVGDRFLVAGETVTYECRPPATGEPAWRWSDPLKTTFRIHTVEVAQA